MIFYKKIWLLTKEEFIQDNAEEEPNSNMEVIPGYYLSTRTNLGDLTSAVDLETKGAFDYAVPQNWFEENQESWKDDWTMRAVWFYPKYIKGRASAFGEPLRVRQIIQMLHEQIAQDGIKLWIDSHGGNS